MRDFLRPFKYFRISYKLLRNWKSFVTQNCYLETKKTDLDRKFLQIIARIYLVSEQGSPVVFMLCAFLREIQAVKERKKKSVYDD